jgi:hypothetical protein
MDTFTAAGDPNIEQVVGNHMRTIVSAIRSGMEPDAILVRGSFGKGEGDVLFDNGHLHFLSDYEINVATFSFRHRRLFNRLARQLTDELGVNTSIVWMRPDYFERLRVGPFVAGPVPITINLYETRYGARLLYGRDLFLTAPQIDPACISMASGLQLLLNRMAEALQYLPEPDGTPTKEWDSVYWINKLVLACLESLLLSWKEYHYSYGERGKRFSALAAGRLAFMGDQAQLLREFAQRATEFKLHPSRNMYPDTLESTTRLVVSIFQRVFAHLATQEWGLTIDDSYTLYPEQYLRVQIERVASFSYQRALYKLLDVYRYVRTQRVPLNLLAPNTAGEVVYSIVPLLFTGWGRSGPQLTSILDSVRRQLRMIVPIPSPALDARADWRELCQQMLVLWKNFCT